MVYLGLGSNLGDRRAYIDQAVKLIRDNPKIKVIKISSIIETLPQGGPEQGKYLNAVMSIQTSLTPTGLLNFLQAIEKKLGRKRIIHWGPRTIDLDILLWGDKIIRTKRLTIPHKYMHERDFVMGPLVEIYANDINCIPRKRSSKKRCKEK